MEKIVREGLCHLLRKEHLLRKKGPLVPKSRTQTNEHRKSHIKKIEQNTQENMMTKYYLMLNKTV